MSLFKINWLDGACDFGYDSHSHRAEFQRGKITQRECSRDRLRVPLASVKHCSAHVYGGLLKAWEEQAGEQS